MARRKDGRTETSKKLDQHELTPFQKTLLAEAERKVTVRIDGEAQEATLEEIVARKLLQVATSGSPHALGHVLRSVNEAQRLNQALIRERVEEGIAVKEQLEKRLAQAIRDGTDPVWIVPHPDDVVIHDQGWTPKRPMNEDELKPIREQIELRDVLLLQSVLDERLAPRREKGQPDVPYAQEPGSTSVILAQLLNGYLPTRFQLSDTEMIFTTMRHERLTRRELLKTTRLAWRSIGRPTPRGWTLPPWHEFGPRLERLFNAVREVFDLVKGGAIKGEREIAKRLGSCWRCASAKCPRIEVEFSGSIFLAGRGTEDDEGIEIHGRAEGVYHQAGRGRHAGCRDLSEGGDPL